MLRTYPMHERVKKSLHLLRLNIASGVKKSNWYFSAIASVCTLFSVVPVIPTVVKPFDINLSTWVLQDTMPIKKKIVQLIIGYTNEPDP